LPGQEIEIEALRDATAALRRQTGAPLCVTRAEHGILVSDPELTLVPGVRLEGPLDPTGAGDSVTAGAVLALAAGATLAEAALVGILVASITVQQLATTGVATPSQVVDRLQMWRDQNRSR
jgi:sugar/nucleoside kinase (ribokinase family)